MVMYVMLWRFDFAPLDHVSTPNRTVGRCMWNADPENADPGPARRWCLKGALKCLGFDWHPKKETVQLGQSMHPAACTTVYLYWVLRLRVFVWFG